MDRARGAVAASLLASGRQVSPDPLGWIRVHLLNAVAITAAATVLALFVPFILLVLSGKRRSDDGARPSAEDRATVLTRVRNKWITGVLQSSLPNTEHLELSLRRRPDAVENREQPVGRQPGPAAVPAGKSILEIFDEAGGGLLILGPPGAGKTTLLLELASALLDRAEANVRKPIPIVANLSSWASRQEPLATWLADEVALHQYRVPARDFRYWLSRNRVTVLLDGLDEVDEGKRDACAAAINDFRREHGLTGLAVCCLSSEAGKLGTRLQLEEAVELELPADTQVDDYLRRVADSGIPVTDIRRAIATDGELRELLRSPLMLHVVTRACQGTPGSVLRQSRSPEVRLHRLWDEYLQSMFERRPANKDHEIRWLEWLAATLRDRGETEFYLDRLTLEWLPPRIRKRWRLAEYLSQALSEYIRPVEGLHWSWRKLKSRFLVGPGAKGGAITAASIISTAMIPLVLLTVEILGNQMTMGSTGVRVAPFLLSGVTLGLCCVAAVLLSLGWTTELRDARTTPNEGIRRSAKNGILIGLLAAVIFGLIFGLADAYILRLDNTLAFGLVAGISTGIFTGLVFGLGAFLVHYLVRALLALSGATPWRYKRFLDRMSNRQIMRQGLGSYMFAHQQLRNHLADREAASTPRGHSPQVGQQGAGS